METGDSEEATLARRGAAFLLGRLVRGAGGDVLQVWTFFFAIAIVIIIVIVGGGGGGGRQGCK